MKNLDKKVAVSPSTATICSADASGEDAERELLEQMQRVYDEMLKNTKPADPEIAEIINKDFWEMYDRF